MNPTNKDIEQLATIKLWCKIMTLIAFTGWVFIGSDKSFWIFILFFTIAFVFLSGKEPNV